jgi:protein-disulfide isomerase-like protein with CxxC motif
MERAFSLTWDYRCPFARNAHEHVVEALRAGAPWQVTFVPFSLSQVHVAEGDVPIWDDPTKGVELLALQAGVVTQTRFPDDFLAVHLALFGARHEKGEDLREADVVRAALAAGGVDPDAVFVEIEAGWPLAEVRTAHEHAVKDYEVFGVPTFIKDGRAAFVRLMTRPEGDGARATATVGRVLDLLDGAPDLNEFKHTTLAH